MQLTSKIKEDARRFAFVHEPSASLRGERTFTDLAELSLQQLFHLLRLGAFGPSIVKLAGSRLPDNPLGIYERADARIALVFLRTETGGGTNHRRNQKPSSFHTPSLQSHCLLNNISLPRIIS